MAEQTVREDNMDKTDFDELRPEITLDKLDLKHIDKSCITTNGECDFLRIPLIKAKNEKLLFEFVFCALTDKYGINAIWPQPVRLHLLIDDTDGERNYYIGTYAKMEDLSGKNTQEAVANICLTDSEKKAIEQGLKKIA